jgi:5-methylcytosine-specific restriction endonuclease McrA
MTGEMPAMAFDLDYQIVNGRPDYSQVTHRRLVAWDEWITLKIRPCDAVIETARGWLRAPTVILAPTYDQMPDVLPKLSARSIYERDNWICQYSSRRLRPQEANIDHVIPRDRGGSSTWSNMVTCDRQINSWKGNRLNHECGLKLIRRPRHPLGFKRCALIRRPRHPDWLPFLTSNIEMNSAEVAA